MNLSMAGVRKSFGVSVGLMAIGTGLAGCAGGNPPVIDDSQTVVSCVNDGSGYVWDFVTLVDDPDGYEDVTQVYVDVYDDRVGTDEGQAVDTFQLSDDGNGQWSTVVYEGTDTQALECENILNYQFDFFAVDASDEQDGFTFLP